MPSGRPRLFDEDEALTGAMLQFWEKGLSATSLDDLAKAMNMNRPSIYNAFGKKEDIYRKTLARFHTQLDEGLRDALDGSPSLHAGLNAFFNQAIEVYCGNNPAMGCLVICTAPSEALSHAEVGDDLRELIQRLDSGFAKRLVQAQQDGELSDDADPKLTAKLLQAVLQTLAIRARAGGSCGSLRKLARYAVETIAR